MKWQFPADILKTRRKTVSRKKVLDTLYIQITLKYAPQFNTLKTRLIFMSNAQRIRLSVFPRNNRIEFESKTRSHSFAAKVEMDSKNTLETPTQVSLIPYSFEFTKENLFCWL